MMGRVIWIDRWLFSDFDIVCFDPIGNFCLLCLSLFLCFNESVGLGIVVCEFIALAIGMRLIGANSTY